jgi:hypothetical protein
VKAAKPAVGQPRRLPVLIAGAALLAVAGAVGGTAGAPGQVPVVGGGGAPAVALSSEWSCAGFTADPGSPVPGRLLIDDAGNAALAASVRLVAENGSARSMSVSVPAGRQLSVPLTFAGPASGEWAGALVELYRGLGSVYEQVQGPEGAVTQACGTSAAAEWHFAGGSVLRNSHLELSLVNPFPAAAVVDVSFATNEGPEQPLQLQGVVVPARGLTALNLGAALLQRADVATTVVARAGEVVAWETQRVTAPSPGTPLSGLNPALPVPGVALSEGLPAARSWWWASGGEAAGVTETYEVYNPGSAPATAQLELLPGGGKGTGSSFSFTVGPDSLYSITTNGEPWALPGVSYAAHVTSSAPVVAERSVWAVARGIALVPGQLQAYTAFLLPASEAALVYSPTASTVAGEKLGAGDHAVLPLTPGRALVLRSSSPVYVQSPAVPLG